MLWAAGVWFPRARAASPLATAINTNDLSLVLDERLALPRLEGYPSDEQKRDREETVMLLEQFQQRYPGGLPVSVDGAQMRHGAGLDPALAAPAEAADHSCPGQLHVPPVRSPADDSKALRTRLRNRRRVCPRGIEQHPDRALGGASGELRPPQSAGPPSGRPGGPARRPGCCANTHDSIDTSGG